MAKIISIHSFRGGTGKSNTTANLAALLAATGLRIGVIDTDIQSPGIHILFGQAGDSVKYALNDYLWDRCDIRDTAIDITPGLPVALSGKIFLIPSSIRAGEIARILREGFDAEVLTNGISTLITELDLDFLLIDTHPGLNEETLLSMAISNVLLIVMRPDQQDYEGTGVTVQVASALNVPRMLLLVNKIPEVFGLDEVQERVRQTYKTEVAAALPHSDEMMSLASGGIFVLHFPDHPITERLRRVATTLQE